MIYTSRDFPEQGITPIFARSIKQNKYRKHMIGHIAKSIFVLRRLSVARVSAGGCSSDSEEACGSCSRSVMSLLPFCVTLDAGVSMTIGA